MSDTPFNATAIAMSPILNWQPEPTLIAQVLRLAQQRGQSPETLLTEAILLYLETQPTPSPEVSSEASDRPPDPLIGLFSGAPDLSTRAEEILR